MPYADYTGGGGGGFTLGPPQNVFTGADRTAAESARDTYFTANPSNLAQYNADTNLNIRLEFETGGNSVALFQVRNSAGTAWLDNSSAEGTPGRDGTDGMGALDQTIPVGTVLRVGVSGSERVAVASSVVEGSTELTSSKTVSAPGGAALRTGHFDLVSAGSAMSVRDLIDSTSEGIVTHGKAVGNKPYYDRTTQTGAMVTTPADGSETSTGTTFQTNFANLNEGEATSYRITRAAGADRYQ